MTGSTHNIDQCLPQKHLSTLTDSDWLNTQHRPMLTIEASQHTDDSGWNNTNQCLTQKHLSTLTDSSWHTALALNMCKYTNCWCSRRVLITLILCILPAWDWLNEQSTFSIICNLHKNIVFNFIYLFLIFIFLLAIIIQ